MIHLQHEQPQRPHLNSPFRKTPGVSFARWNDRPLASTKFQHILRCVLDVYVTEIVFCARWGTGGEGEGEETGGFGPGFGDVVGVPMQ